MSDLRVYGFSIQVENQDGTTKVRQFRKAVSDLEGSVELLNREMGDNVKVTAEVIQSDKEALAQARLLLNQQERQRKKTEEVVRQYTTLNNTIRQYGNDAETVNAITRLGSTATDAQKQQVAELVAEYQRLRNAGDANTDSMRNMRGVAQNLGWQLQDVVVQAQMGTDAFIIMSQQGSQFAASFGATGALIGAGIAIAGAAMPALISYLDDAEDSTTDLETATKRLNEIFDMGKYSVNGFNKELVELFKTDSQLAELMLLNAVLDAEEAVKLSRNQIKDYVKDLGDLGDGFRVFNSVQEEFDKDVQKLALSYGIHTDEVLRLNNAYQVIGRGGSADQLVQVFKEIANTNPNVSDSFKRLALQVSEAGIQSKLAQQQLEKLAKILSGETVPTTSSASRVTETLEQRYERLRAQLTMTDRQIEIDNFLKLEAINLTGDQVQSTQRALIAYLDERDAIEARNDEIERAKALDDARIKQRNSVLDPIEQSLIVTSSNPVNAENERNQQTMNTLRAQLSQTKQYEYSERARINDLIEREEQRHTEALFDAQLTLASNQVAVIGSTADFMSSLTDELFEGGERVRAAMEEMNTAQKVMFFVTRGIAAAQAVINGISLGVKLAETFGTFDPTTALANSYVQFGLALGSASAGAIMGTTFAGAFDKGGFIPSGSTGIVSEYGDELVNGQLVRGPARVTSREDTAKMMNGGGMTVNLINNAPGVDHQVNRIDENTVEVIANKVFANNIDSGVAGVLNKKGTKTDRAMRQNYQGGARKY